MFMKFHNKKYIKKKNNWGLLDFWGQPCCRPSEIILEELATNKIEIDWFSK